MKAQQAQPSLRENLKKTITKHPKLSQYFNDDNFDIKIADSTRRAYNKFYGGGGSIEAWFPDDKGVKNYSHPSLGKYVIEVFDKNLVFNPDELKGYILRDVLHFLPEVDKNWRLMRDEFANNFLPEEKYFLQQKFLKEKPKAKDFNEWMDRVMIDGYIRGAFDEPSDFGKLYKKTYFEGGKPVEAYSPTQRKILQSMKDYLGYK
jgi:hypothetical protein